MHEISLATAISYVNLELLTHSNFSVSFFTKSGEYRKLNNCSKIDPNAAEQKAIELAQASERVFYKGKKGTVKNTYSTTKHRVIHIFDLDKNSWVTILWDTWQTVNDFRINHKLK